MTHLRVQHGRSCKINDAPEEPGFTIVRCLSKDKEIQSMFLRVISMQLIDLGGTLTPNKINELIEKLRKLFEKLNLNAKRKSVGLWGEVFLIANAKDPNIMIDAWHEDNQERFDFSMGKEHLEIKTSTSKRSRNHHFKLEQVCAPLETRIFVCSIYTEKRTGGTSLKELREKILHLANTIKRKEKIEYVFAEALGEDYSDDSLKQSFDANLAKQSIAFYDTESPEFPKISCEKITHVTEVSFKSNLDQMNQLKENEMSNLGKLYSNCLVS